ncbi:MAG: peptidyl-prolyl cis-trans isomerase B (cyclophilin B) [Halothiobacillaceae bacterium]|nr:MAG: peptidyl-prolyl cis-trans isomerase B (cyclophilin B) [Halothiobacillaceae bacterium]
MMKKLLLATSLLGAFSLPLSYAAAADAHHPRVVMKTSMGDITLELNQEKAPITVNNFLTYVKEGFYSGTIFHRFQEKKTHAPIKNEANNGLKNELGTIAMARRPDPDSASAQFFINVVDNDFLNHTSPTPQGWGYAVFGKVVAGMEVVEKMRQTPTGSGGPFPTDVPATKIVINSVELVK